MYIGTHDNDTVLGWMDALSHGDFKRMLDYLNLDSDKDIVWKLIRIALGTVCDTAVLMMQDLLELGSEARINTPLHPWRQLDLAGAKRRFFPYPGG